MKRKILSIYLCKKSKPQKMKRSILMLLVILSASLSFAKFQNVCGEVFLQVSLTDPTETMRKIKRSPIEIPSINLEGRTLIFVTPCDGCILRLINEDEDVEYITIIPVDATNLDLPTCLSGEYQLQIIRGNYCFWGYINF